MKTCVAVMLLLVGSACFAGGPPFQAAYPEPEAAAAWRSLAATYVRKALDDKAVNNDPVLNARVDAVMSVVGAAAAAIDARFAGASWKTILIEDFGRGAAAFPGETILVDAAFVRSLQLGEDELALVLSHEVAHVLAGHAAAKLSFMAQFLGKTKLPTARDALIEFLSTDQYAAVFQPSARLQEREADELGAAIFFATGFDAQRALGLFDKLARLETRENGQAADSHDTAGMRKQAVAAVLEELERALARRR